MSSDGILRQKGGSRIGRNYWFSLNYTRDFAEFTIEPDKITLESRLFVIGSKYVFERTFIEKISDFRGIFSKGVRIHHSKSGIPPFVVFWASDLRELKERLVKFGYPLKCDAVSAGPITP